MAGTLRRLEAAVVGELATRAESGGPKKQDKNASSLSIMNAGELVPRSVVCRQGHHF